MRTAVVAADEIFELRWAVLRAGQPRESAAYAEDSAADTIHIAVYDDEGLLRGCGTFYPEALPGEDLPAYRIRGMASDPEVRGRGYGGAVLRAGLAEAAARGGRLAWCNGRTPARGFYEHHGFQAIGDEFEIEPIGPHYVFVTKDLRPPSS